MVSAHGSLEQHSHAGRVCARTFAAGVTGRAGVAKQAMPELSQLGGRRRLARPGSGWCGHASHPRPVDPASNSRRRQHACVWQEPGAAGGNGSRGFHADVASRECARGPRLGSSCDAWQLRATRKWSVGVWEYWSIGFQMHHSIIPSLQYSGLSTYEPWTRTWRDTRLPRFGYTHRVSIVDIRSLDHHPDSVGCGCVCARLARTQSSAAKALRGLAPDCIPSRPPLALSRPASPPQHLSELTPALPHDQPPAPKIGAPPPPPPRGPSFPPPPRLPRSVLQHWVGPLFASKGLQRLAHFLTHPLVC